MFFFFSKLTPNTEITSRQEMVNKMLKGRSVLQNIGFFVNKLSQLFTTEKNNMKNPKEPCT